MRVSSWGAPSRASVETLPRLRGRALCRIRKALAVASGSQLGLHEVVEAAPGPPPDAVPQQRRPTEQQPRRPERLARPAVEAELVAMLGDQAVAEAESGPHVVVHVAAGLRERVVRQPPR